MQISSLGENESLSMPAVSSLNLLFVSCSLQVCLDLRSEKKIPKEIDNLVYL